MILWGESANPANYAAIAILPVSFSTLNYVAIGLGSLGINDNLYTKTVSMIKELCTTNQLVFRTSLDTSPTVFYIVVGH